MAYTVRRFRVIALEHGTLFLPRWTRGLPGHQDEASCRSQVRDSAERYVNPVLYGVYPTNEMEPGERYQQFGWRPSPPSASRTRRQRSGAVRPPPAETAPQRCGRPDCGVIATASSSPVAGADARRRASETAERSPSPLSTRRKQVSTLLHLLAPRAQDPDGETAKRTGRAPLGAAPWLVAPGDEARRCDGGEQRQKQWHRHGGPRRRADGRLLSAPSYRKRVRCGEASIADFAGGQTGGV